jgi:hypothetical protein
MFISLYTGFNYRMIEIEVPVEDLISRYYSKSSPSGYEYYNNTFTAYRPSRRDTQQGRSRCRLCVVTRERAQQEYNEEERHAFAEGAE